MNLLWDELNRTASFLKERMRISPTVGIILGSGLGDLVQAIAEDGSLEYARIPHFPVSTAVGHAGRLIWGRWAGTEVLAMQGRFHFYEGYGLRQVVFPVRVMKLLGCQVLITTNAAGSLNPSLKAGSIMVVTDHLNLLGDNPLVGPNLDGLGPRFPDLGRAYDPDLVALALEVARKENLPVRPGILTAVSGPSYETAAEYRAFRLLGADAVGMSVIAETIAAAHCRLRVLAFSGLTDECFHPTLQPLSPEEVIRVAEKLAPALKKLIGGVLMTINDDIRMTKSE